MEDQWTILKRGVPTHEFPGLPYWNEKHGRWSNKEELVDLLKEYLGESEDEIDKLGIDVVPFVAS